MRRSALAVVAVLLGVGLAIGQPSIAHADDLDNQYTQVQAEIQSSQSSIDGDQAQLNAALASLHQTQDALQKAQATQAQAEAAQATAQRKSDEMATALQAAQQRLVAAQAEVDQTQAAVNAQIVTVGRNVRLETQQNSSLVGISMLLSNVGTGDLANRVQWASGVFNATQNQLDALNAALAQLQAKRDALATAKTAAQQARDEAVQQLDASQTAAQAAAKASQDVSAKVTASQTALAAAQNLLNQALASNQALQARSSQLAAQIQQRNEAAATAARAAASAATARAAAAGSSWVTTNIAPGQLPPISVDSAVSKARSMIGNQNYGDMCLALVAAFYGYSSSGTDNAFAAAQQIITAGQMHYDLSNIPVGALVFYDGRPAGNPYGHVAMYAGNGMIYSNGAANYSVGTLSIDTPSQAWGEPIIGWSSVWLPNATG